MQRVVAVHPQAQCRIAGEGDELSALQAQLKQLNLGASVQLLGFRKDIPALMRACDVFVLPSLAEPFGLVILEAMALGKPVIATRDGGPPEIVADQATGILVPPRDPAALAGAIGQLVGNPAQGDAMGQAGLARYQSHFTVDRMAREILAIYQKCLAASAKA